MTRVATRRLLDASATLDAADRALLNIWVNRDLDDRTLARMTGLDDAAVAARRLRIVTHLSATLGLPPDTVRRALHDIAASADRRPIANGSTSPAPDTLDADLPASPPSAVEEPASGSASRRRLWRWGALLIAIVAVVLIVTLSSGGSEHSPRRAATATGVAVPAGEPLVVLAGGPAHATGTTSVTGRGSDLSLHLSVSNLPPASHGHDEIWLYDSIIYARDLGRLPTGDSHLTLRLPPNAPRFRWIDISFQPPGVTFHSGESLLRSPNPLFRKDG